MILTRLREETRDAHEHLEARMDILGCTRSLSGYKGLLAKFYGFYLPLERRLSDVAAQGLAAANGAAFFNGYGSETGAMWRAFGDMLRRYAASGMEDGLILQGAVETFAALEVWLAQGEHTT